MNKTTLKRHYKEHIREVNGFAHKNDSASLLKKRKQWRFNRDHIRNTFIERYIDGGLIPYYLVSVSYWYDEYNREKVEENNDRFNKVINDFFNRYGKDDHTLYLDHFIERREDKLDNKIDNKKQVLNTITNQYESDWSNREVVQGSFDSHHLVSYIPDEIIRAPGTRVMNAIETIYSSNGLQFNLRDEDRFEEIKCDLIDYALRKRCRFIGHGEDSLDVRPTDSRKSFDGYSGWKGALSYCTKQMYNVDKMLEVYDYCNSNILKGV